MDKEGLANISKYKKFLADNGCPENLPDYGDESYWDARFELQQQEVYDWYAGWDLISPLFKQYVSLDMKIMELGTGKSAILGELAKEGYKNLVGTDFSYTLINQRRKQERDLKRGIRWERLDVTKKWRDIEADCIFQKATLDCLPAKDVKEAINQIYKVLGKDGIFFHISNAKPENRITILKKWDVKVYEIPKTIIPLFSEIDQEKAYYIYICIK